MQTFPVQILLSHMHTWDITEQWAQSLSQQMDFLSIIHPATFEAAFTCNFPDNCPIMFACSTVRSGGPQDRLHADYQMNEDRSVLNYL